MMSAGRGSSGGTREQGILPHTEADSGVPRILVISEDDEKGGISSQAIKQLIDAVF